MDLAENRSDEYREGHSERNDRIVLALLAGAAAVAVIIVLKLTRGKLFGFEDVKKVVIDKDVAGMPTVEPDSVYLKKAKHQKVHWKAAQPGLKFSVAFNKGDGTPFGDGHGRPKALFGDADPESDEIIVDTGDFHYRVTLEDGSSTDPNIIIH